MKENLIGKVGIYMRILIIRSNPVNPDSRVEKETNSIIKHGHNVEILGWDRNNKYVIDESYLNFENGKAKIYRFGIPAIFGGGVKKNLFPLIKFQVRLYRWLKNNIDNYDAIHACDFDTAYIAFKVAKKHKKRFIYDIFDFYVDSYNVPNMLKNIIKNADFNIITNADTTIICSEQRIEQIKGSSPNNLVVIHNSPPRINICSKSKIMSSSKIKIVYVGILSNGRFIKEIADIVINDPRFEFHIGGFGQLDGYFENLSKENTNILYYGRLSYKRTLELESSCDIITAIYDPTNPNHRYAAPNKFYEALMLGKPLIMAHNTGMDEIVEKYNIGVLINYEINSFKEKLVELSNRKNEWGDMNKRMKSLYDNNYSWDEMERRLINIYNKKGR